MCRRCKMNFLIWFRSEMSSCEVSFLHHDLAPWGVLGPRCELWYIGETFTPLFIPWGPFLTSPLGARGKVKNGPLGWTLYVLLRSSEGKTKGLHTQWIISSLGDKVPPWGLSGLCLPSLYLCTTMLSLFPAINEAIVDARFFQQNSAPEVAKLGRFLTVFFTNKQSCIVMTGV
jgi:hypothetical protein